MRCACIDIGSNTTRLLVAEPDGPRLAEIAAERVFTRIGAVCGDDGAIPAEKIEEVAAVVSRLALLANDLGARQLRVVATAAIRHAPNGPSLCAAVRAASGLQAEVLDTVEEARLAFLGATGTCPGGTADEAEAALAHATVAVIDVGGGSTEIVVGTPAGGATWMHSVPLGSSVLMREAQRADRPSAEALATARDRAEAAFARISPPAVGRAVVVGGSTGSLRLLAGDALDNEALTRALDLLAASSVAEIVDRHGLHPERVRMLPAGLVLLVAVARALGDVPLQIGHGGLREGVVLELLGHP